MLIFLILFPLLIGGSIFLLPDQGSRKRMLIFAALLHSACVFSFWKIRPAMSLNGFLGLDALGLLVLSVISVLFLMVSFYLMGYFKDESEVSRRIFIGFLLFFLSFMTLVTLSRHFGLLLIGIEATTLCSVPLINFVKTRQSIEATWKFLMICLIGIALALLGTYFLAVAGLNNVQSLFIDKLIHHAGELSWPWLKMSVIFLLIGCGTKMGLAPMHTWLPDAHSQAPSPISALLSGCLLNCAFLSILRVGQVCHAAGLTQFFSSMLILLGIISMGVAFVFILGQEDYKRMFAYSSVEHMGILAIGIGLGPVGIYGALLHMINNAFTKGIAFLTTGNLYKQYHSKKVSEVRGVLRAFPITGIFLLAGFMAVSGVPPFGTFISEMIILYAAIAGHHYLVAFFYCLFLGLIFIGIADIILKMTQGQPDPSVILSAAKDLNASKDSSPLGLRMTTRESLSMILPILFLIIIVLILGFYIPPFLNNMLQKGVGLLGG
jgi:hydrogenase-4 component F